MFNFQRGALDNYIVCLSLRKQQHSKRITISQVLFWYFGNNDRYSSTQELNDIPLTNLQLFQI